MICGMAILNGREVRERAAELAPRGLSLKPTGETARVAAPELAWLSERTGIPVGTIHNATRDTNPQPVSMTRVYDIAAHLSRAGEDVASVARAIRVAGDDEPSSEPAQPETPPADRPRDPSAPPGRRNGKDNRRGPKRNADLTERGVA